MGIISNLFGGGTSIKDIAEPIDAVGNALDNLFTSDEERANAAAVMEKLRQKPHILQAEISKLEASHRSSFVAGWRPALGWVSALSFAWIFVFAPLAQWILVLQNIDMVLPTLQADVLLELTFAMLGLAGLRSFEKAKGITK